MLPRVVTQFCVGAVRAMLGLARSTRGQCHVALAGTLLIRPGKWKL